MTAPENQLLLPLGRRRKTKALTEHEEHKRAAITWLRKELAKLFLERAKHHETPYVNADDARQLYDSSKFPAAYSANLRFFGSVFRGRAWKPAGFRRPSRHPANNARKIECWRYDATIDLG